MEDALVELESSMCALLRGERVALRRLASPERADRFRELAVFHGLAPLLCSRLRQSCPEDAALAFVKNREGISERLAAVI